MKIKASKKIDKEPRRSKNKHFYDVNNNFFYFIFLLSFMSEQNSEYEAKKIFVDLSANDNTNMLLTLSRTHTHLAAEFESSVSVQCFSR
jgi:hypothetical protein